MARMGEIQFRGDGSDPKQVFNYMLQLEEQIKYALAHIGEENIEPGSITMEQMAPVVKQSVQQITFDIERQQAKSRQLESEDGRLRTLIIETERGIMAQMDDMEQGLTNTIQITAAGLTEEIENNKGDITNLKTRADGLETRVTNAEGDITGFKQTATSVGLSAVGIDLTQADAGVKIKGNYFTVSKDGVDITGNGAFTVNMTNFELGSNGDLRVEGDVTALSGKVGDFDIVNGILQYAGTDGYFVQLGKRQIRFQSPSEVIFDVNSSGVWCNQLTVENDTKLTALYLYDSAIHTYKDVTSAILALL